MNDKLFRVLLDLWMVSDPWPLEMQAHEILEASLSFESWQRGYTNMIDAYHEFVVLPDPPATPEREEGV